MWPTASWGTINFSEWTRGRSGKPPNSMRNGKLEKVQKKDLLMLGSHLCSAVRRGKAQSSTLLPEIRILLKTPGEHPSVTFISSSIILQLLEGLIPLPRGNQPEMVSSGLSLHKNSSARHPRPTLAE
ncbi:uncharacterized protein LOC102072464 isoform X2 [Zonotrichia albicollis]|uniref:uncharacterized protein LOC102072464 isoform X2 n=1 Tax=Zonotrichia albicollis TaxID=44394 RepID=UPI003D80B320